MKPIDRRASIWIALALAFFPFAQDGALARAAASEAEYAASGSGLPEARRLEDAAIQSANLYLQDAKYTTDDFLEEVRVLLEQACPAGGRSRQVTDFCNRHRLTPGLILHYNAAKHARASAVSDADQAEVIRLYRSTLAFLGQLARDQGMDGWIARVKEGIAYAHLKRGEIDLADRVIGDSLRLDDTSSWVGLTAIKVHCARGVSGGRIRGEMRAMRRRLDAHIESIGRDAGYFPQALRNARIERRIVERDRELFEMCRYARLRPMDAADPHLEPR